jgi:hypothetical protein
MLVLEELGEQATFITPGSMLLSINRPAPVFLIPDFVILPASDLLERRRIIILRAGMTLIPRTPAQRVYPTRIMGRRMIAPANVPEESQIRLSA